MNRDELLERLAMEVSEWPVVKNCMQWDGDNFYPTDLMDRQPFSKIEWLAERERLINKPGWSEAPEWAEWISQQPEGMWCWSSEPRRVAPLGWTWGGGREKYANEGVCPAGHHWKNTLEQRPALTTSLGASEQPYCPMLDAQMESDAINPESPSGAASFLIAALSHMEDRATTYDAPSGERSMGKTVAAFNALTGHEISETEGWLLMAVLKMARSTQGDFRADNYEDLAAYSGLAGESAAREPTHE